MNSLSRPLAEGKYTGFAVVQDHKAEITLDRVETVSCITVKVQLRIVAKKTMATTAPKTLDVATAPHVPSFGLSQ